MTTMDETALAAASELDADIEIPAVDTAATTPAQPPPAGPFRRIMNGAVRFWAAIVLVLALACSGGVAAWLYVHQYLPDRQTDAAAAEAAIAAATEGTVALLSYAPDSLDADFANAKTMLTGDFLNYYNQFTEQIVTPAATKNAVKTQATVVNSAVSELHPDRAVVLVFLNQITTSSANPDGSFSTSSVKVGLSKVGESWRIAAFDPV